MMQAVFRNIIAALLHYFTGAASTLEASAEGASTAMEKTIQYRNGDTYIGHVDNDGQRDGKGILRKKNGDVYEGQFKDGMLHGEGKYTWADGDVYDGQFIGGMRHGEGKYTSADGDVYDGEFRYDFRHGKGKMKFKDGQECDGEWQEGIFEDLMSNVSDIV